MHIEDYHYNLDIFDQTPDPINCFICHCEKALEAREREMFLPCVDAIEKQIRFFRAGIITVSELITRIEAELPVTGDA